MRIVTYENGRLEVKFMWLPVFIGQNMAMMKELQIAGQAKFGGLIYDDKTLAEIDDWVVNWICKRFPIEGLDKYLRAIEHVKET